MPGQVQNITSLFKGRFLTGVETLPVKLQRIKAFLFDWDGVFNDGEKKENGSSAFSEVDAMATNLLRFSHYIIHQKNPVVAVLSGEKNASAFTLAEREHFHAVYYKVKHKINALDHFCENYDLQHEEVAFFFDDVLDLSVTARVGLRIMIGRSANPLLLKYVEERQLADYITANDGGRYGVREGIELLMGISGKYEEALDHRTQYSPFYLEYLAQRDRSVPEYFTANNLRQIVKQ
jgi:3-deoxy-D-manno-octulosonate 8-phosphate phosphatase (KDO 8-P phosphatase)